MDRRDFIKSTATITAAGLLYPESAMAIDATPQQKKLIVSSPMLQNYAETSIGIAFAVSAMANGYVLISEKEDLSDAIKIKCGGYRVTDMNENVMLVRVTNLKPATKYYYKIGADRISYKSGYNMKVLGTETDDRVYSFTTAGEKSKSHFCVINDTHAHYDTFNSIQNLIKKLNPSCVVWNGDASNCEETIETQKKIFLCPPIDRNDYASETPYLLCPGNHDNRGLANRHLEKVWMFRQPEERLSRDWDLGRNFAVRMGDIAMIGLDTAEDKLDENPLFAGLFTSASYRKAQVAWLKHVLSLKKIKNAPYIIAFCHIPLYSSDPKENPGDLAPDDGGAYASWQRTCSNLWTPILQKAGCKLIICGHMHRVRIDSPEGDRKWTQVVGGGPNKEDPTTVIDGMVIDGKLNITIYNAITGETINSIQFNRR